MAESTLIFLSDSSHLGQCETEFRAIRMIPATQRSVMGVMMVLQMDRPIPMPLRESELRELL